MTSLTTKAKISGETIPARQASGICTQSRDQFVIRSLSTSTVFTLNRTSLNLLLLCDGDRSISEVIQLLCDTVTTHSREKIVEDVYQGLMEFDQIGLISFFSAPIEAVPAVRVRYFNFPQSHDLNSHYISLLLEDRMLVLFNQGDKYEIGIHFDSKSCNSNQKPFDRDSINALVIDEETELDFDRYDFVFSPHSEVKDNIKRHANNKNFCVSSKESTRFYSYLFPRLSKIFRRSTRRKISSVNNKDKIRKGTADVNMTTTFKDKTKSSEGDNELHVFLNTDMTQRAGLFALIHSIIRNTQQPHRLHFHILVDSDPDFYKSMIEKQFDNAFRYEVTTIFQLENYTKYISFLDKNLRVEGGAKESHRIRNIMNYFRFFLPDIHSNIDLGLYLDVDMLVQTDVLRLLDEDLTDHVVASVLNRTFDHYHSDLDMEGLGFNAGILLINFDLWRRCKITDDIEMVMMEHRRRQLFRGGTQPILNVVFNGTCKPLDQRWNKTDLGFNDDFDDKTLNEAWILHWNGSAKPWKKTGLYKHLWTPYQIPLMIS